MKRIRANGVAAAAAHDAVRRAFDNGLRTRDPRAYDTLLVEFRSATAVALAPLSDTAGDQSAFLARLDAADPLALQTAIAFLDADPWFFRSGYVKANLIRRLKRAPLGDDHKSRLRDIVLRAVAARDRREFRDYCRLAAAVESRALIVSLRVKALNPEAGVSRRARWMLGQLKRT